MLRRKTMAGALLRAAVIVLLLCGHGFADAHPLSRGDGDLRVMTYNIDEGTEFRALVAARTPTEFLLAVGDTITEVRATDPTARMEAVATQILAANPMLVSLQEVDQWFTGPFDLATGTCGNLTLEIDMLRDLLAALTAHGGRYAVAAHGVQRAFPATPGLIPPAGFVCAAVVNRNVILARTDLRVSKFRWGNPQSAQFDSRAFLPTPLGPFPVTSGWASVDAVFDGRPFRFIGGHLESNDATVREQQGAELRGGPAVTTLPLILAMDSNAQAAPAPPDPTYVDFVAAGYADAWAEVFPRAPGSTCCQVPLVNNPVSELDQRIDLILTLGPVHAQRVALFGADAASMTPGGLWPSDHAGVAAQVVITGRHPGGGQSGP